MKDLKLHLIDIDQVNNILFLNTRRTSRVSGIIDHLEITLNDCFMKCCVYQFKTEINHSNLHASIQYGVARSCPYHFILTFFLCVKARHKASFYRKMLCLTCIFKCKVRFNTFEIRSLTEIAPLLKLFPRCTFIVTFDITKL